MQYVFGIVMTLTALFLILLVLVQRGRGGGLAGAFGGMGGQSAFGTKAGDTFTKITIGVSVFWLLLCVCAVRFLGRDGGRFGRSEPPAETQLAPRGTNESVLPEVDPTTEGLGQEAAGDPSALPQSGAVPDDGAPDLPSGEPSGLPPGQNGSQDGGGTSGSGPSSESGQSSQSPGSPSQDAGSQDAGELDGSDESTVP